MQPRHFLRRGVIGRTRDHAFGWTGATGEALVLHTRDDVGKTTVAVFFAVARIVQLRAHREDDRIYVLFDIVLGFFQINRARRAD